MYLDFRRNNTALTLGVETELQVLDEQSLLLTPRAPEILEMLSHDRLTKEMFRSTLEIITGICSDVHGVREDIQRTLPFVKKAGRRLGIRFASTGTNPIADYNERIITATTRYQQIHDRNQWLIRRMAVYGLHVHIGMRNGDECIRFNNFFLHFIPHMIALSASSPFWKCLDTGLAASRPTVYESHPTSGSPYLVENWDQFNELYQKLIGTGSIMSMRDIWWDLRPSPTFGTLEIRICDGPATMLELESIVAWIHLLAHWFADNGEEFFASNPMMPMQWVMRENKWRAIRYGIQAEIINHKTFELKKLSDSIHFWLEHLAPYAQKLGYEPYMQCISDIVEKGNSASRQRAIMLHSGDIHDVVTFNIREFELGQPIWE